MGTESRKHSFSHRVPPRIWKTCSPIIWGGICSRSQFGPNHSSCFLMCFAIAHRLRRWAIKHPPPPFLIVDHGYVKQTRNEQPLDSLPASSQPPSNFPAASQKPSTGVHRTTIGENQVAHLLIVSALQLNCTRLAASESNVVNLRDVI